MSRLTRTTVFLAGTLLCLAAQAADPSLHQVYQAAEAGRLVEAQQMMDQVLKDHPNSSKAHFVEAEILARQGDVGKARSELATAERLDPQLAFAKPGAVNELRAQLRPASTSSFSGSGLHDNRDALPAQGRGFPWGLMLGGLALLAAVFLFFRSRAAASPSPYPSPYSGPSTGTVGGGLSPAGYGGPVYGGGAPGASSGLGSSMLGGLATGAAVGAGMVAGEALMHKVFDGDHHDQPYRSNNDLIDPNIGTIDAPPAHYDMGGQDFGVNDAGSWDDGAGAASGSADDDWN